MEYVFIISLFYSITFDILTNKFVEKKNSILNLTVIFLCWKK